MQFFCTIDMVHSRDIILTSDYNPMVMELCIMRTGSNNAGAIKKMSLEEFLGDDTLGDSVWNEDEINLDAISNTTNIDFLKTKSGPDNTESGPNGHSGNRMHNESAFDFHHRGGFGRENDGGSGDSFAMQGPPYIVKFSLLPPRFSDADIHDLFHEKFTKFVKFKLFWELNKNPSIDVVKSGSIFDQNFRKTTKVGFVELYTGRDMDKILKYWSTPLLKIHNIKVEPAEFNDFKEYRTKVELLTDPNDDAGKPYIMARKKSNPFGAAKPVDTQSKILAIEDTVGKLHIEDTRTLRRLSGGETTNGPTSLKSGKVQILKKPKEVSKEAQPSPPPLRYVDVMEKQSGEEQKKKTSPTATTALPSTGDIDVKCSEQTSASLQHNTLILDDNIELQNGGNETGQTSNFSDSEGGYSSGPSHRTYGDQRPQRGGRGGGYSRGNSNKRGGGGTGGGNRGGNGPHQSRYNNKYDSANENENYQPRTYNNHRANQSHDQNQNFNKHSQGQNQSQQNQGFNQEEKRYSMFKPASGFLWENGKNNDGQNHSRGGFNNHNNHRGSRRGGFNNRGRHNNGFTPA